MIIRVISYKIATTFDIKDPSVELLKKIDAILLDVYEKGVKTGEQKTLKKLINFLQDELK